MLSRILAFGLVLLPAPALAVTMVPNPATLIGVPGTLTLVDSVVGLPADGVVLDGAVAAGDVTLVFEIANDVGTGAAYVGLDWVLSPSNASMTAVGTIPGPGIDVIAGFLVPIGGRIDGDIDFDGGVGPGETSDRFFASYASSPAGFEATFRTLSGGLELTTVLFVPEGSALAGLASVLALAALHGAAASLRRRRSFRPPQAR